MTAMELKCLKMELVEELLSIDDKDTLNRVKNYLKKLNNKIRTKAEEEETEYISKEEILAGIDERHDCREETIGERFLKRNERWNIE